jgi:hypothetical protein
VVAGGHLKLTLGSTAPHSRAFPSLLRPTESNNLFVRERRDFMSESFQILMAGNNRAGLRGQPYSISVENKQISPVV